MKSHQPSETRRRGRSRTDLIGAAVLVLIGLFTVWEGLDYPVGSLSRMGPGYFPVALGGLLALLGVLVALTTDPAKNPEPSEEDKQEFVTDWRGWSCIIGGIISFCVFGHFLGLVPATFALVFISALGDRTQTVPAALILATGICVVGTFIFSVLLQLQFPLFRWN